MNWSTSVYTTQSSDTEPSVAVTFNSAKYVFNVGENTTRAVLQSRRGWKKIKGIFLTDVGTQRASGVPGMLMSIADASARKLAIVGPTGVLHLLASMRLYTFRNTLCINPVEVLSDPPITGSEPSAVYQDENITVYSIPISSAIHRSSPSALEEVHQDAIPTEEESSLKRKRDTSPDQPSKRISPVQHTVSDSTHKALSSSLIDRLRDDPEFNPTSLSGDEAQAWRRMVVDHMFTWIEPPPPPRKERKKPKKKEKEVDDTSPLVDPAPSVQPAEAASTSSAPQIPHWVEDGAGTSATNERVSRRAKGSFNPAGSYKQLPPLAANSLKTRLAYVIVGPRVRGKFDVNRADELGLQGRLRGQLSRGETVQFMVDDGKGGKMERIVKPEDCIGPSETPGVIIILDVPSPGHIDSLMTSFATTFSKFRSKSEEDIKEYRVHVVYHMLGDGVLEDERYKAFMSGFADHAHHLVASRHHSPDPITFTSASFSQLRLNQLDPDVFALPKYKATPEQDLSVIASLPSNTSFLHANTITEMRPPNPPTPELWVQERDKFHPAVASPDLLELPSATLNRFAQAQKLVQTALAERKDTPPKPGDDVVIVPLGTSSAVSSRYRNVSGMLVQIPGRGNMLLDAGEGTWGQLARYFGTDPAQPGNVWDALRELKCVFVSHAHADHHGGIAKILALRRQLDPPPPGPLYLVSGYPVQLYLREYAEIEDLGLGSLASTGNGVVPIMCDSINVKPRSAGGQGGLANQLIFHRAVVALSETLGLESMNTVDVRHRTKAFGLVMTHRDGWRLVYSGDTMPTANLVRAGDGATILIHEATMADDQEAMARLKAHSTIGQAISIGKQMHAENILLTHFSSRYPLMPEYLADPHADGGPTIALALDHARMRLGDMWKMPLYFRAIEQSFWDTKEEGDEEEEEQVLQANVTGPE